MQGMGEGPIRAAGRASGAGGRPLRVLLSEAASTSAREAVTALGLAGHHVEVMDPGRLALARASRFVRRFHRCPPMGADPEGYRDFVLRLVGGGGFDVLLPIHEQGFLLARIAGRLAPHVAVALPAFESYAQAVSGAGFVRLLDGLGLAQPGTQVVTAADELRAVRNFPVVLKAEIGTASRAVWIVRDAEGLARAAVEIERAGLPDGLAAGGVLVQDFVAGPVEHAQAVFARGRLVAAHGFRQLRRGAGGGPALKESVARPVVRGHLARIGAALEWHGALSVDYILGAGPHGMAPHGMAPDGAEASDRAQTRDAAVRSEAAGGPDGPPGSNRAPGLPGAPTSEGASEEAGGAPVYIDCNPRLVEPMSALAAGVDLVGALLQVSLAGSSGGEPLPEMPPGRDGVRTRLAMQALMGLALDGSTRRMLLCEGWRAVAGRGAWADSCEELTPVRLDPPSLLPLLGVAAALAVSPRLAGPLAAGGWGAHLLTPAAVRRISAWPPDDAAA